MGSTGGIWAAWVSTSHLSAAVRPAPHAARGRGPPWERGVLRTRRGCSWWAAARQEGPQHPLPPQHPGQQRRGLAAWPPLLSLMLEGRR